MVTATDERSTGNRWVEIPNDVSNGMQVLEAIVLELRLAGYESRQIGQVELAYTEALTNAVRHGNQDDPQKIVIIEYRIDQSEFRLAIEDEGQGFDPRDIDDPTQPEHLVRPGGRGLLLIRSLVETVEFSPRGNRIVIRLSRKIRSAAGIDSWDGFPIRPSGRTD